MAMNYLSPSCYYYDVVALSGNENFWPKLIASLPKRCALDHCYCSSKHSKVDFGSMIGLLASSRGRNAVSGSLFGLLSHIQEWSETLLIDVRGPYNWACKTWGSHWEKLTWCEVWQRTEAARLAGAWSRPSDPFGHVAKKSYYSPKASSSLGFMRNP